MTLDDYTMILPTWERIQYLDRFFDYHRGYAILAVDSSKEDHSSIAARYPHIDYRWLGPTSHFKKMRDALDRVTTAYVSIGSDDDFHIAEGIADCIRILRQTPEAVCVHGANVNFEETPEPNIRRRNHKTFFRNGNLARRPPLPTPMERFDLVYRRPCYSPYNAVFRTVDLKKVISIMLDCGFEKPGANDYGFVMVASMFGDYLGSKQLFCLKNLEAPPVRDIVKVAMVDFWEQVMSSEDIWRPHYDPDRLREAIPMWKGFIAAQARRERLLGRILGTAGLHELLKLVPLYRGANRELMRIFAHA